MTKSKKSKRTEIKDLAVNETELTLAEARQVVGGKAAGSGTLKDTNKLETTAARKVRGIDHLQKIT